MLRGPLARNAASNNGSPLKSLRGDIGGLVAIMVGCLVGWYRCLSGYVDRLKSLLPCDMSSFVGCMLRCQRNSVNSTAGSA
jgi:hypothetical protein